MDIRSKLRKNVARGRNGQTKKVCPKLERSASLRKVSNILRKSESQRSADEKAVLATMVDEVQEVKSRFKRNQQRVERSKEVEEDNSTLKAKCIKLAQVLKRAHHLVVYTGAGISTAANIPDYRGPNGIWTLLQQGKEIGKHDLSKAQPTYTHMALKEMYRKKMLKFVVSQNCDGLHLRSGLPKRALSEVHGNMYIEVCKTCKPIVPYWRLFDTTENTSRFFHKTCRICHYCGGSLTDSIVHFGEKGTEQWPLNWAGALHHAAKADVILCLGSSLKVLKKYSFLWAMDRPLKKRPDIYIVNLQWTPKDDVAAMKIHGRCDKVMSLLMDYLKINVPPYKESGDPIFYHASLLSPRELHTTTQPMLIKCNDSQTKQSAPNASSDSEDDCPLVMLRNAEGSNDEVHKPIEQKNNIAGQNEIKHPIDSKQNITMRDDEEINFSVLDLSCAKVKLKSELEETETTKSFHEVEINMKTEHDKTEKVNILLLNKHSPTKMDSFAERHKVKTEPFCHNNSNIRNNYLPLDTGQVNIPEDFYKPINLCLGDINDDDIESKLQVCILPRTLRLNQTDNHAKTINGITVQSFPIRSIGLAKPKNFNNLRNFRILKKGGVANLGCHKNGAIMSQNLLSCGTLKEKTLKPLPGLIKLNGIYQSSPQDLTIKPKREICYEKIAKSDRVIKFDIKDTEVEIHKARVQKQLNTINVLDLSKSDEFNCAVSLHECETAAHAIIKHTLTLYRSETNFFYSGLETIVKPVPYLNYDFSLFDAKKLMEYGKKILNGNCQVKRVNEENDKIEMRRKPKRRKRLYYKKKRSYECEYCLDCFKTYYCCFYKPHNSDSRVENKKKKKFVMCDCCGDTESSEAEDDEGSDSSVKDERCDMANSQHDDNSEDGNRSLFDNDSNAPQPGWFGKGYRKNRRRKR